MNLAQSSGSGQIASETTINDVSPLGSALKDSTVSFHGFGQNTTLLNGNATWLLTINILPGVYFLLFNLGVISLLLSWGIIWPSLLVLLGLTILYETLIPHKNKWCGVHFSGDKNKRSQYREENGFVNYE